LTEAKHNAETSRTRNVGITVETRPDWAKQEHVNVLLDMGVTRIELGVQNPDDKIYKLVGRTHTVQDVKEATRAAKDAGLKVAYHLMPGMPGSNPRKDLVAFMRVFTDPDFKPDMLKIYPCLVMEGTRTHEWYRNGTYKPYSTNEAVNLIAELKKTIPPWVRVMRVQRDIPARLIVAGVKKSNLRQLVHEKLKSQSEQCECIRCREIGHRITLGETPPNPDEMKVKSTRYEASEGKEIFIEAAQPETNTLVGYLRLRIPSPKAFRPEILAAPSAIVRELHVYGPLVPVGKHSAKAWQHKGFGATLLSEAERVAKDEFELEKILVISALGTKRYYRRFGYKPDGVYVSKSLEM
jgi:elongator complex protein 3